MPNYQPNGNLEIGIHIMEWEEFKQAYGYNETRRKIIDGMALALASLKKNGYQRVYNIGAWRNFMS